MKKTSAKQVNINGVLSRIKAGLPDHCIIPGCVNKGSDLAHLLPRSLYPEHITNPLNLVRFCRACHDKYDSEKAFRRNQKKLYEQVKTFDEVAANRYFF